MRQTILLFCWTLPTPCMGWTPSTNIFEANLSFCTCTVDRSQNCPTSTRKRMHACMQLHFNITLWSKTKLDQVSLYTFGWYLPLKSKLWPQTIQNSSKPKPAAFGTSGPVTSGTPPCHRTTYLSWRTSTPICSSTTTRLLGCTVQVGDLTSPQWKLYTCQSNTGTRSFATSGNAILISLSGIRFNACKKITAGGAFEEI